MPKIPELTAKAVNDFAHGRGDYRGEMLCVSKGLYLKRRLLKNQSYQCHWVYRTQNPAFKMQFASYPTMTLAQARVKANEIQLKLLTGIDPKAEIKALRQAKLKEKELAEEEKRTFAKVAALWMESERKGNKWKNDPTGERHAETNLRLHILPVLGDRLIKNITWRDVYKVHTHEELYKKHSQVARKCRAIINAVCTYANIQGWTDNACPAVVSGALAYQLNRIEKEKESENLPALNYKRIPEFFRDLQKVEGIAARALEFVILTASRQGQIIKSKRDGEICGASWDQFDFEEKVWRVPAKIVKQKTDFDCYLSTYAIDLLKRLPRYEGCPWVFTANGKEPISNGAIRKTIQTMNQNRLKKHLPLWVDEKILDQYGNPREITTHGTARSCFRTWATTDEHDNYKQFHSEAVEICITHRIKISNDKYDGAYNRPTLVNTRKRLMQAWARYCYTGKFPDEE